MQTCSHGTICTNMMHPHTAWGWRCVSWNSDRMTLLYSSWGVLHIETHKAFSSTTWQSQQMSRSYVPALPRCLFLNVAAIASGGASVSSWSC